MKNNFYEGELDKEVVISEKGNNHKACNNILDKLFYIKVEWRQGMALLTVYILKSPMKRIHKIKTKKIVKNTISDEEIEKLRDNCKEKNETRSGEYILMQKAKVHLKQYLENRFDNNEALFVTLDAPCERLKIQWC